tara:strand:+ start:288 stop:407 length:120 start_codon:yes stop_codon:yes gene_type:complete
MKKEMINQIINILDNTEGLGKTEFQQYKEALQQLSVEGK